MTTHDVLFNVLADDAPTSDLNFHRLRQNPPGKRLHLTWKCSGKHDSLTVGTHVVYHSHHLSSHTPPAEL